jgi:chromosome segregation ATPase
MAAGDLANLKAQLHLAMKQVAERETALAAAAEARATVPQTLAQVDALEQKLSEAIEELRARRAEIQKAAGPAGKKGGAGEKK